MSYRKFNQNFIIATVIALGAIAGVQGCSSDDPEPQPTAGRAGANAGRAGADNDAGEGNSGGTGNNGGTGNDAGAPPSDAGAAGEAGGGPGPVDCDHFLRPCPEDGVTCEEPFDNSKLTKLVNGEVPPLP
jgi:hypothetical protein